MRRRNHAGFALSEQAIPVARNKIVGRIANRPGNKTQYRQPAPRGRQALSYCNHRIARFAWCAMIKKEKGQWVIRINVELLRQIPAIGRLDRGEADRPGLVDAQDKLHVNGTEIAQAIEHHQTVGTGLRAGRIRVGVRPFSWFILLASGYVLQENGTPAVCRTIQAGFLRLVNAKTQ
jgi:hypothetical protein